jgi:hypothetical protein
MMYFAAALMLSGSQNNCFSCTGVEYDHLGFESCVHAHIGLAEGCVTLQPEILSVHGHHVGKIRQRQFANRAADVYEAGSSRMCCTDHFMFMESSGHCTKSHVQSGWHSGSVTTDTQYITAGIEFRQRSQVDVSTTLLHWQRKQLDRMLCTWP